MFITIEEFSTHIHPEIMELISRDDDSKIISALETGLQQAGGYLSRFDIVAIYATAGEERKIYSDLISYIKDIAKWHFINICNANIDFEIAEIRYKAAITELGKIQAGKVTPMGWPLVQQPQGASGQFYITSRKKRGNHY